MKVGVGGIRKVYSAENVVRYRAMDAQNNSRPMFRAGWHNAENKTSNRNANRPEYA